MPSREKGCETTTDEDTFSGIRRNTHLRDGWNSTKADLESVLVPMDHLNLLLDPTDALGGHSKQDKLSNTNTKGARLLGGDMRTQVLSASRRGELRGNRRGRQKTRDAHTHPLHIGYDNISAKQEADSQELAPFGVHLQKLVSSVGGRKDALVATIDEHNTNT